MDRKGATQIVFSAVGFGDMVAKSRGFDAKAWVDKRLADAGISRDAIAWMNDQNTHAKEGSYLQGHAQCREARPAGQPEEHGYWRERAGPPQGTALPVTALVSLGR
jgi:hypothetical protein